MGALRARDIPNLITLLRIALVLPVVWALLRERYPLALWLFAVAGISDGLDGFLAKHFHWTSRLGAILDPIADKLLLVSCYLCLGWLEVLPLWLVGVVLGRDLFILAGATAYHFLIGHYDPAPTWISKTNTFAQIVLVIVVVLQQAAEPFSTHFVLWLIYTVLATTVTSGVDYVWTWGRMAWVNRS
ncbi:CDP-alcohol phosphatidyltransferase family protein [Thioalbus denitrificans]|jgi:cardiolipin synthase|uniref:CDP-diacylglycerol--glycerol-3-phosphate 3-phosphatidyltransferase n=1 Tax=Thioalbus denitrificans TaxID=547122 RepID=A0A369C5P4_9GAMM|nr:cardiolipin synthase [Thioalbus denitrificans]